MPEENGYSQFIEHLSSRVLDLPDSESLIRLVEATLNPEEAEFLSGFPFLPHPIEQLAERFNQPVNELRAKLDSLAERGILFWRKSGDRVECALNDPWFIFCRSSYWAGKRYERTKNIAKYANRYYYSGMGHEFGGYPTGRLKPDTNTAENAIRLLSISLTASMGLMD